MIYFDSAATTLQKPSTVPRAVATAIQRCASPGRGAHPSTRRAEEILYSCREAVANLFDVEDPGHVIFTFNATHALNLAIRSVVRPGSRVLISCWEHNAVTRTLAAIPDVEVTVARGPLFDDEATVAAFRAGLETQPNAVICTYVSNVFGYILPIERISSMCRSAGIPLILDASQAAGCLPLSVKKLDAEYIAFPGHKGLYGPQGTGVLLCCGDSAPEPLLFGGTGSESLRQEMPAFLPDRVEAGTHNVAGIAGLLEGIRFVRQMDVNRIAKHEKMLMERTKDRLLRLKAVRVFAGTGENQSGVLSFVCDDMDAQVVAQKLGEVGVAVRAGLHCAPLAHQSAGTLETGTVRVSFSALNRIEEVDQFALRLWSIIHNKLT